MFINGEWVRPAGLNTTPVFNPSTGEVIAETPVGTTTEVNAAVEAAHAAFNGWFETPAVERARVLFRYRELLLKHFDDIAATISRERWTGTASSLSP